MPGRVRADSAEVCAENLADTVTTCTASTAEEFGFGIANEKIATITLTDSFNLSDTVTIDRALTIDGDNNTITSAAAAALTVNTELSVEINDLTVKAQASGSKALLVNGDLATYDVTINGSTLQSNTQGIRAGSGKLSVNDSTIEWIDTNGNTVSDVNSEMSTDYSWALVNFAMAGANWSFDNTNIQGYRYVTYFSGDASGAQLSIANGSYLSARSDLTFLTTATAETPFMVSVSDSTLHGINLYSGSQEDFGNIVFEPDATNTKVDLTNVIFTVYENETALNNQNANQYAIYNKMAGDDNTNTVEIYGSTSYVVSDEYIEAKTNERVDNFSSGDENEIAPSKSGIVVYDGVYSYDPVDYVAEGKFAYYDSENENYSVDDAPSVSGIESSYDVRAGKSLELDYTLLPEVSGNWIDVYSLEEDDTCGELNCIEFDAETQSVSVNLETKVGAHTMEYILANGETGTFVLNVLPQGEISVSEETVYVNTAEENVFTFEELGVVVAGEGYEGVSKNNYVSIDYDEQTVTVWDSDEITWSYKGEEKGRTTFVSYYLSEYQKIYGVMVGHNLSLDASLSENVTARIADESIAKIEEETMVSYSDGEEYTYTTKYIRGLKSGKTVVEYVVNDGTVVKSTPVKVFALTTNLKGAQAVGTSQTFTVTLEEGYEAELFAFAAGMPLDDDEEASGPVELMKNADGSYTLTVKEMPVWTSNSGDEEGSTESGVSPYVWIVMNVTDEDGNHFADLGNGVIIFEFAAEDAAAEVTDNEEVESVAKKNEAIMTEYTSEIISAIFENGEIEEGGDAVALTLSDGAKVTVSDPYALMQAVMAGETIEAVLTEPKELDENVLVENKAGAIAVASLYNELGFGKSAPRLLEIEVNLVAGDDEVGKITELGTPLVVSLDVNKDKEAKPVAEGYKRNYVVFRYHDGVTEEIEGVEYDDEAGIVTFPSDKFSMFLVAYQDVAVADDAASVKTPETGLFTQEKAAAISVNLSAVISVVAVILAVTLYGAVKFVRKS